MARLEPTPPAPARRADPVPPARPARRSFGDALRARTVAARPEEPRPAREEERCPGRAVLSGAPRDGPDPAPSLQALARARPVAIAALGPRAAEGLSLELARAVAVELRASPAGVELTVRPAPAHARVAAAELPGLVEALRRRGVAVARAEVRGEVGGGRATRAG